MNAGFGRESQSGVYERILGIAKTLVTVSGLQLVELTPTASEVFRLLAGGAGALAVGKLKEDALKLGPIKPR